MDNVIIYDKLEELNEGIEYNGGGITSLLGKGVVKSVQRGFAKGTDNGITSTVNIEISTVNAGKCAVLVNAITTQQASYGAPNVVVRELQSNRLILDISYPGVGVRYMTYSWQVIEFY